MLVKGGTGALQSSWVRGMIQPVYNIANQCNQYPWRYKLWSPSDNMCTSWKNKCGSTHYLKYITCHTRQEQGSRKLAPPPPPPLLRSHQELKSNLHCSHSLLEPLNELTGILQTNHAPAFYQAIWLVKTTWHVKRAWCHNQTNSSYRLCPLFVIRQHLVMILLLVYIKQMRD